MFPEVFVVARIDGAVVVPRFKSPPVDTAITGPATVDWPRCSETPEVAPTDAISKLPVASAFPIANPPVPSRTVRDPP